MKWISFNKVNFKSIKQSSNVLKELLAIIDFKYIFISISISIIKIRAFKFNNNFYTSRFL